jgi:hypothetical protein
MADQKESQPELKTGLGAVLWRVLWVFGGAAVTIVTFLVLSRNDVIVLREYLPQGKPGIHFGLNETGGALLSELTRRNIPSGVDARSPPFKRHLAIILNGLVMSAPTIDSEIGSQGQITCDSDEEVENLVKILRSGAAWAASLQRHPLEEKTIDDVKIPGAGGGTVLVYQIVPKGKDVPTPEEKAHLIESLKRFFDQGGVSQVTVRPTGNDRIEVIVPAKGKPPAAKGSTSEDVKRIKHLVSEVGLLEFRILANSEDDKAAIEDAMKLLNSGTPEVNKALEKAQLKGLPPPGPRTQGLTGEPKVYDLVLAKGAKSRVTYSWLELGPWELRKLKLDAVSKDDPKRNETWKEAAKFRGKATTLAAPDGSEQRLLQGTLFYSRECKDQDLPEEELAAKPFEYFVLARDLEIDPATGKASPRIDGSYLRSVIPYYRGTRIRADFMVIGVVAALGIIVFFLLRLWLGLRWEFLIGHGVALVIAVVIILTG